MDDWLAKDEIDLTRGFEYAAYIFNATIGDGTMYQFNGNVRNFGLIDNLPEGLLRGGAGAGQQRRALRPCMSARCPTSWRSEQHLRPLRGAGRRGLPDRRQAQDLPRHLLRPADQRGLLPQGDRPDGGRDVRLQQGLPAPVQPVSISAARGSAQRASPAIYSGAKKDAGRDIRRQTKRERSGCRVQGDRTLADSRSRYQWMVLSTLSV